MDAEACAGVAGSLLGYEYVTELGGVARAGELVVEDGV